MPMLFCYGAAESQREHKENKLRVSPGGAPGRRPTPLRYGDEMWQNCVR